MEQEKRYPRVKSTFLQKSKYRHMLDDRRLGWLCEHFDTTPQEMAKLSRRKAEDFLYDLVTALEDQGKRSSYISNLLKAAKSWQIQPQTHRC
jgi:hypothetical protein